MNEIYISTDIETDGPNIFRNSMLSFGSAAYSDSKRLMSTFEANLYPLSDHFGDEKTMEWWKTQPEAWRYLQLNRQSPGIAMPKYLQWIKSLPGKPVFVAYPAGFDFNWIYNYLIEFANESPFSFSALDIKTYAMAILREPYRACTKKNFPRDWFDKLPHTHKALDDAIEQGAMFINMLQENYAK